MVEINFEKVQEFFNRHQKVVLQLSAGKDSAACLWLLRPWWDRLYVVWCNQGNPYPETLAYMEYIAGIVPNFFVVRGNQPVWIKQNGYPVDVLPLESTAIGKIIASEGGPTLQPYWSCCGANSWQPMEEFLSVIGATGVIRGQKSCDELKSPESLGAQKDGIEYFFPVEDWSDQDVIHYVGSKLPDSYKRGLTKSFDCMNCTAFMKDSKGRLADLYNINREAYDEVSAVHGYLKDKLKAHIESLEACNG
jgi:3'-phosphoadenosine 5'-phosphosulfate sulfotransferase (PAPS reductase)/FAD synthetase